jgi:hypothetical protein
MMDRNSGIDFEPANRIYCGRLELSQAVRKEQ